MRVVTILLAILSVLLPVGKHLEARTVNHVLVSLENSRHVWHAQRGTSQADILFEMVVEGHITRLVALYRDIAQTKGAIGPVRSMRNYFVPFFSNIGAILFFCGASPSGYGRLAREQSVIACDEIHNGDAFHRRKDIESPHNLYTNGTQLVAALSRRHLTKEVLPRPFPAAPLSITGGNPATFLICYTRGYHVGYQYDPQTGLYQRTINGAPHLDAETGKPLAAAALVFLHGQAQVIDKLGRLQFDIGEELPADVYLGGIHRRGTWSPPAYNCPLLIADENDMPIPLPSGLVIAHLLSQLVTVSIDPPPPTKTPPPLHVAMNTKAIATAVREVNTSTATAMSTPFAATAASSASVATAASSASVATAASSASAATAASSASARSASIGEHQAGAAAKLAALWSGELSSSAEVETRIDTITSFIVEQAEKERMALEEWLLQRHAAGESLATACLALMRSARARPLLIAQARHGQDSGCRADAVLALSSYGDDAQALEALVTRLDDDEQEVRAVAALALLTIGNKPETPSPSTSAISSSTRDHPNDANLRQWLLSGKASLRQQALAHLLPPNATPAKSVNVGSSTVKTVQPPASRTASRVRVAREQQHEVLE